MNEWSYEEGRFLKYLYLIIFVGGDIFLFGIVLLGVLFFFYPDMGTLYPTGWPYFLAVCVAWNLLAGYLLMNLPQGVTLTENGLCVLWTVKKQKSYPWRRVRIITIGFNPTPMILIKQEVRYPFLFDFPRILTLSVWSSKYKKLIRRIESFTQDSDVE